VHRRRMVTVDGTDRHSSRDTVLVSPSGASMVLVCWAMTFPEVTVYTRETGNEGMLGWTESKGSTLSELLIGSPLNHTTNLVSEVFSPCGSRALFLYQSAVQGVGPNGILVVDLVKTAHSDHVHTEWRDWNADTMPSQVAWSEDGLFVRTASTGGVLRVGLVA